MLHGEILHNNLPLDCKNVFGGGGGVTILPIQQQFLYTSVILQFMYKSLSQSAECMPLWNFDF